MKNKLLFLLVVLLATNLNSCKKDELSNFDLNTSAIKTYSDIDISMPMQIVSSGDRLLCVYGVGDFNGKIKAMLLDAEGTFIKEIEIGGVDGIFSFYAVAKTNGFVIVINNGLLEIDLNGEITNDVPDFFALIINYDVYGMLINKAGNYLLYGQYKGYAFVIEYTPTGQLNYKKLIFNQHPDNHCFTGAVNTSDGGAMLFGCQSIGTEDAPVYYLIVKITSTGDIEWRRRYKVGDQGGQAVFTAELLDLFNGQYVFFANSTNRKSDDLYARAFKINADGDLMDSLRINIGGLNMIAGSKAQSSSAAPWRPVGAGVAKTSTTALTGIILKDYLGTPFLQPSYSKPHQSARFNISENFELEKIEDIQSAYSDYITSMVTLSDGSVAAFGMIQSFGGEFRPILIIYKN